MAWLETAPGLAKAAQGRAIHALADAIDAKVLAALFPEMTASPVPLLFACLDELPDERVSAEVTDIMGRFAQIAADASALERLDPRRT